MKRINFINRILSFLIISCCLAGSIIPAHTSKASDLSGGIPRVVFENEPKTAPDLYIKKTLENEEDFGRTQFSFTLKLDGKLANRQQYTVIDTNGNEKTDWYGNKVTEFTNNGIFYLAAGETAWFKDIPVGTRYEVTESETPYFLQVKPEGKGSVAGTMTAEGEQREFVNRFIPNTGGEKSTLTICKTISFPEGYTAPETPDFQFVLSLEGEPYGQEDYTIIDNKTGNTIGTGTTDQNGKFTLKGGYTASFEEIPAGIEYKAEEIELPSGWRTTSDKVLEGVTQAPETPLFFNNANASFAVTKRLDGNEESKEDFKFLLTREDHSVWAGAEYYLYNMTSGEMETEEKQPTGSNGIFTLKAGQAAIFTGIEPGTVYNVSEVANPDYIQTMPVSAEGYTGYDVTDSVEILPFINKEVERKELLTVTKRVESTKGDMPSETEQKSDEFRFVLYEIIRDENGNIISEKPKSKQGYSISVGGSVKTYATDDNGSFTIKANETATFEALPFGEYKVEEVNLPEGYKIKLDSERVDEDKNPGQTGTLTRGENLAFTFTNEYRADKLDLNLTKVSRDGEKKFENIPFELRKANEDGGIGDIIDTYVTDSEGKLSIRDLSSGTYYLQELKAATGYQVLEKPLKIVISRSKDRSRLQASATVDEVGLTAGNLEIGNAENTDIKKEGDISESEQKIKELEIIQTDTGRDEIQVTVINDLLYSLPNSGGPGIFLYILSGIALMMAASFLYWKKFRLQAYQN